MNTRTPAPGRSAPAGLKKDAGGFDLPIALGLLLGNGQIAPDRLRMMCRPRMMCLAGFRRSGRSSPLRQIARSLSMTKLILRLDAGRARARMRRERIGARAARPARPGPNVADTHWIVVNSCQRPGPRHDGRVVRTIAFLRVDRIGSHAINRRSSHAGTEPPRTGTTA
jgi:hypothetical protein